MIADGGDASYHAPMPTIPRGIDAFLFDMDGVLTDTARVHAAAWKQTFDEELERLAREQGAPFVPFDLRTDYERYVDGRPRYDGVRAFLASRGIERADVADPRGPSVHELGDRKNVLLQQRLRTDGVDVHEDCVTLIRALRARGHGTALVSSSANARTILEVAGVRDLFDVVVDGTSLAPRGLRGKPAPDSFVAAAGDLGAPVARAAVLEDAVAGVAAGRAGGFGLVVGVARHGEVDQLLASGADVVVERLTDLELEGDPEHA